jgi:hypothetical protein
MYSLKMETKLTGTFGFLQMHMCGPFRNANLNVPRCMSSFAKHSHIGEGVREHGGT